MHAGWFAVDRELLASDLWLAEKFSRAQAWIDLMGLARFKPGYVRLRGKRIDLGVGQIAWSQQELARRWRWSPGKVRAFIRELKSDGQIDYRSVGVTTVITLLCCDNLAPGGGRTNEVIDKPSDKRSGKQTDECSERLPTTKEPRQPSKQRQPPDEKQLERGWGEILSSLKLLGVSAAGAAVESAQAQSFPLEEVQAWIEEFRKSPGAWGPGALVGRLTGKLADWPPPAEEYQKQQRREAFERSYTRQAQERAERKAELERQRQTEAKLEIDFGPVLDAMTNQQRTQLEQQAIPDAAERQLSRQYPSVHRGRLLAALGASP